MAVPVLKTYAALPRPQLDGVPELTAVTVMLIALEVLDEYVLSPPYDAVTESVPVGRAEVVSVADPELKVPVPSEVDPLLNVIVPVAADGETFAVKVMLVPTVKLVDEAEIAVVEAVVPPELELDPEPPQPTMLITVTAISSAITAAVDKNCFLAKGERLESSFNAMVPFTALTKNVSNIRGDKWLGSSGPC